MQPTLYRGAAIAHATSPDLILETSVLVEDRTIIWIGPDEAAAPPSPGTRIIDAGGAVVVPGMVDAHSHITLPGGSHWIARIDDDTTDLLDVAEHNADLMRRAGVRWARDVGSPRRRDPDAAGDRALALVVRDRWRDRVDRPYVRAAGTWIGAAGALPPNASIELEHGADLVAAVTTQLEDGADLVKLYLDGPDREVAPFTVDEVRAATEAAHRLGAKVTAHATNLVGASAAVAGGVDCVEHGTVLDADVVQLMADQQIFVVPTLAIHDSWTSFGATTTLDRFTGADGRRRIAERREIAYASVRLAREAGVPIAAGTDFGGGSLRANQLAWEVEALVAAGLEPWEALAAATWRGGDLLGEPGAGRLVVDGPADFFLVHGNPLDDPSSLWRVWCQG
jgi:imidazolonepropionase-like amidohydrolase